MESKSIFSNLLSLKFGSNEYVIPIPQFVARDYPLLHNILKDEPNLDSIPLMKDKKLTKIDESAIDFLFALKYSWNSKENCPSANEDPQVLLSALHWAQYLGLNKASYEVCSITASFSESKDLPEDVREILKELITKGIIRSRALEGKLGLKSDGFPFIMYGKEGYIREFAQLKRDQSFLGRSVIIPTYQE